MRNITYVGDCVDGILAMSQSEKSNNEVFFAVSGEHISVAEIAKMITKHIGGSLRLIDWPKERKMTEIGDAIIGNNKIKKVLNWTPKYDFTEGLILTKKYYKNCLKNYLR